MSTVIDHAEIIMKAYKAFNERDIDAVLLLIMPDVAWPNGWKGGYVYGHDAIRNYWARQWAVLSPHIVPVAIDEASDGRINVSVQQTIKDIQGDLIADGMVTLIYTFTDDLIAHMEIA
ncbi:MAG TPA: nuclear transport factor 2 family protein [Chitinophagaceae bacterium]|nr:nuclear transport factor 2 family protein [Chitinophagaceae bacterium]